VKNAANNVPTTVNRKGIAPHTPDSVAEEEEQGPFHLKECNLATTLTIRHRKTGVTAQAALTLFAVQQLY
jgi:hypothetical protein